MSEGLTEFKPPTRSGRFVSLKPIVPEDYQFLQNAELDPLLAHRWRFRGSTPSPEQWVQATWGATLVQFIVIENLTEQRLGIVNVYRPNFQHGHAYLAVISFQTPNGSPLMLLGLAIFLEYVFETWNFRKLYLETPEFNYGQISSGEGRFFEIEGRLKSHTYLAGRYWDELLLAMTKESWQDRRVGLLRLAGIDSGNANLRANLTTNGNVLK